MHGLVTTYELTIQQYGFMYLCMKTTIDIPDSLIIRAKKRAVELRKPLREQVIAGVREQLRPTPTSATRRKKKIRWVTTNGGVPPNLNVANREELAVWFQRPV